MQNKLYERVQEVTKVNIRNLEQHRRDPIPLSLCV